MWLCEIRAQSTRTSTRRPALVNSCEDLGPGGDVKALSALAFFIVKFKFRSRVASTTPPEGAMRDWHGPCDREGREMYLSRASGSLQLMPISASVKEQKGFD